MSLHIDLAHPQRTTSQWSTGSLLSTGRFGLAVGILAALYVIGFVRLGTSLRLDFDAGYWLGGGTLFVVIGLVGPLQLGDKGIDQIGHVFLCWWVTRHDRWQGSEVHRYFRKVDRLMA